MSHHVWAFCKVGGKGKNGQGHDLQLQHSGSKKECDAFVANRTQQRLPTHFLHVTRKGYEAACKEILP